ncbi:MAG: hypothetical protein C0622_12365 [Desulfuromonas sp.]|nr:MAG: hypothetical protein C0622_12365 [Desulfuromonas sp.]
MPYGPANEIINHARACHQVVADFYQQLNVKAKATRVRMLLDYLAGHERLLTQTLNDYGHDVKSSALNEWHHFASENMLFTALNPDDYSDDMSIDDVLKIVETISNCFIRSYEGVISTSTNDKVTEIFENLLQRERQDKLRMAKVIHELNDM